MHDDKVLPGKLQAPSSYVAKFCDRLVVFHDMDDADRAPYDWSPAQIDKGKLGSSLGAWFPLPFGGPEQVVLPGFHSPAESAIKKNASGDEIFLALCGLMSTGTRTVLLSRWRVAGQSTYDLMREFVQELPHSTAAAAWQRSVRLRMQADIDPNREPRVRVPAGEEPLKASHPFFWSGYLLADSGASPVNAAPPAAKEPAAVKDPPPAKEAPPGKEVPAVRNEPKEKQEKDVEPKGKVVAPKAKDAGPKKGGLDCLKRPAEPRFDQGNSLCYGCWRLEAEKFPLFFGVPAVMLRLMLLVLLLNQVLVQLTDRFHNLVRCRHIPDAPPRHRE